MWIQKIFQHTVCFVIITGRWRLCLDKQYFAGTLPMDPSKTFNAINHELFTVKLHAHRFSIEALEVLLRYLQQRWQRVKINATF